MMRQISVRERRLIALFILTVLIAAVWFCIVAPIFDGFTARSDRREALLLRYTHNQRTIASIPRLRLKAEKQAAASRAFVADVRTAEAGREWLRERLQTAVERSGGEFRDAADAEGLPGWVRVHVAARMSLPQMAAALTELQNTPPWIIVESLSVTTSDGPAAGQSPTLPPNLDVQIEASTPLRPAAAR